MFEEFDEIIKEFDEATEDFIQKLKDKEKRMIVCDFCKKRKDNIDTLVLYSQTIDYCKDCEPIVNKLKKQLKKSIKYYEDEKDRQIKQTEKFLIEKFKCERKNK